MAFGKAMEMMGGKRMAPAAKNPVAAEEKHDDEHGEAMSLHSHGDGSYHTEGPDGKEEHPTLGHALMHMAHHHEPDSSHMHVQHDGYQTSSHSIDENGEHDGPREHEDAQGVHDHVDEMLGGGGETPQDAENQPALSGLGA